MTSIPVYTPQTDPIRIPVHNRNLIIEPLTHANRCDSCQARAYVGALFRTGFEPLYFCAHHFTRWEDPIRAKAIEILDERWRLTQEIKDDKHL